MGSGRAREGMQGGGLELADPCVTAPARSDSAAHVQGSSGAVALTFVSLGPGGWTHRR